MAEAVLTLKAYPFPFFILFLIPMLKECEDIGERMEVGGDLLELGDMMPMSSLVSMLLRRPIFSTSMVSPG